MAVRELTDTQFQKAKAAFTQISDTTLKLAYLTLVKGNSYQEAADVFDCSRANAQRASKKVYDKYMSLYSRCPPGFVEIKLCLPNETIAKRYKSMAAKDRANYKHAKLSESS